MDMKAKNTDWTALASTGNRLTIPPGVTLTLMPPKGFIRAYMGYHQNCLVNLDHVVAIFITQEPIGSAFRLVCETVPTGQGDNRFVLARSVDPMALRTALEKLVDELKTLGWSIFEVKPEQ
jgi:hypothetical protein